MTDLFIKPEILKEIIKIIKKIYPKAIVLAYGSRVRGDAHSGSDLDIVVKDFGQENGDTDVLKCAFNESNIPFFIDVFVFERLPLNFQKEIEKKCIIIYNGNKK